MALSIRSVEVENMARQLSRFTGKNMTEAISDALSVQLMRMGSDFETCRIELTKIAFECASLPDLDMRSPDDILGYDATGGFGHGN